MLGNACAPELVEVGAAGCGQACAHFQAVGLHQIERAQHAVQAREDEQVLLRPGQFVGAEAGGLQAVVHVAVEGQHRLACVGWGEGRAPGGVARHVELRQGIADGHQGGDVLGRFFAQHFDEGLRRAQVLWLAVRQARGQGAAVVQRFGRGEQKQHGRGAPGSEKNQIQQPERLLFS